MAKFLSKQYCDELSENWTFGQMIKVVFPQCMNYVCFEPGKQFSEVIFLEGIHKFMADMNSDFQEIPILSKSEDSGRSLLNV